MPSISPVHPTPSRIRLLIADDRWVVREGLKRMIAQYAGMKVVGEAATWSEVLERLQATEVDVLLLDAWFGGPKLRGRIREVKDHHARCRVLVLNVQGRDSDALRLLGTGAAGYLGKDHSREQLVDAIRQVVRGASYVSPSLASRLISDSRGGGSRPRHATLSDREYQVLCMFGSGTPFKHIAAELGVSPKTVSTYRSRILEKLKLNTNAAIIRYAVEHRLVPSSTAAPSRRQKSPTDRSAGG
jgi:two-component system, NarL family, invasion response regulator UvrY